MKTCKFALPLVLFLLLAPALAADIEPGSWQISATTQFPDMAQPIGPVTRTECISADTAGDPGKILNPGAGSCEFSNRRDSGNTMTFDVTCTGAFPMRGTGSVRYAPQSLDGQLDLTADLQGRKVALNSRVTGRRLGACAR